MRSLQFSGYMPEIYRSADQEPKEYTRRNKRMLVLSRQRDETIVIGDSIRITIVEVRGDKVRIGIDAPKDITVHRQEIYDAIKREMEGAGPPEN
jgi:carbon storage regulator